MSPLGTYPNLFDGQGDNYTTDDGYARNTLSMAVKMRSALARIAAKARKLAGRPAVVLTLPIRISKPDGTRILVLAPHPDDEAIGCGGTLHNHALAGDQVVVAVMTDGRQGEAFCAERGRSLVERRKREAEQVCALLDVSELIFLDHPDSLLSSRPSAVDELKTLLERLQPDTLYVPSFLDAHTDHRATFDIAASAVEQYGNDLMVYIYEVWSPIPANCVVEIDIAKKVELIRCYESQLDDAAQFEVASRNLAKFRAISNLLGAESSAECFWRCTANEYVMLANDVR